MLQKHFKTMLNAIIAYPEQAIIKLEILSYKEYKQIIKDWNQTAANFPSDRTIHQLFEDQVERTPNKIALIVEDKRLSYQELNHRANQLAHHLKKLGVSQRI